MSRLPHTFRIIARPLAVFTVAMCAVAVWSPAALGQAEVQRVEVRVRFDGPAPHVLVIDRLAATVHAAAARVLEGRPLDQLQPAQGRLEDTLRTVLDRLVPGYGAGAVALQLGAVTVVTATFRPIGFVIGDVVVAAAAPSVHERAAPLVLGPIRTGAAGPFRELYGGLPVAALSWASPVVEPSARAVVERAVPGFTPTIAVRAPDTAGRTLIEVTVAPKDSRVIRGIAVAFRSTSIPLIVLDDYEADVAVMADPLRGLPVEFARDHARELAALIDRALAEFPPAVRYRIVATTMLDVAEATRVLVLADSLVYRARVEAQLSIGTSAPGPRIGVHVGRMIAPGLEGFAEMRVAPSTLAFRWTVGAAYALSPTATVGVNYALTNRAISPWVTMQMSRDLGVRAAYDVRRRAVEGALIYRFNEFLSGELIATSRSHFWLRLTSNL